MIRLLQQDKLTGKIFLHSMPGRLEDVQDITKELKENEITKIICLSDYSNIKECSPEYLNPVKNRSLAGIEIRYIPVPDYGVPETNEGLSDYDFALEDSVNHLHSGNLLIHCGAGVGRTGTFAIILLRMLGYSFKQATNLTLIARSEPEEDDQWDFCEHYRK